MALLCVGGLIVNGGRVEAQETSDPHPKAPHGFTVRLFAEDLGAPRGMAFGPDGSLYVTDFSGGRVLRLRDADGDGVADTSEVFLEGLDHPSGIARYEDHLWVSEAARILRVGPMGAAADARVDTVVDDLPADGFTNRSLVFDPSGQGFFVSIGASCDVCREDEARRGTIVFYGLDGRQSQVWARGLRNAVGLAVHPETWELWALDLGRDWLGDDLPPDELNIVQRGRHYGWPYCYGARVPNPEYSDPARCDVTELPAMTLPAHSTPLGIVFYANGPFPVEFHGDAFVALHGSWNRSAPAGYKVVRLRVEAGRPVSAEDFLTGWITTGGKVLGRPVQPLVGPEGALYVSDDNGGRVWRVAYEAAE